MCDTPAVGAVRCHAEIRTDDSLNPLATVGPAGYGSTDVRNAHGITASGTATIAIVDAYGYKNAEKDLATFERNSGCRLVRPLTGDIAGNKLQQVRGKAKAAMGRATNDPELEAQGRADERTCHLKDAGEKVKDAFRPGAEARCSPNSCDWWHQCDGCHSGCNLS